MSELKATPGEWIREGSRDDDEGLVIVQKHTGALIATIESTTGFAAADEANASLIATARELYEELLDAAQNLEAAGYCHDHPHLERIHSVLAKARGES